ncbi:ATP synthase F1 subunit delta [Subsaximicrobium wynnwilliamsii]|uniref:ATP synthase subunit delta n=2 Tax=Subsaximicrobium wynnwilliamsii TaxID=291179 RepID=A0A5C6ZK75_9FLAO|nr:ATP synthase F1 subunit delta [Subsaximicrobium wynnwilliamsii]TXD89731.1 ATP synthase F1 subunit delta [Subsaximicrobium wynnwilliamsii]TXE01713.1 ATP synthase F1 subunit delta [Subsaximicrobium wynnwilliamsii]
MAGERAAIRYAKALLSLSEEKNASEDINKDMALMAETISKSKDLRFVLESPVLQSSKKQGAILAIFKDANALTVNLVDILNTNKRIPILGEVASQYMRLYDELKGIQVATVTTAVALDDVMRAKVLAKVKELTGKQAEVTNKIDESILGGFILRVGDTQYDASVANKLNKLKREFTLN